ncbi:MAG: MarR family transcriptional regulator [Alphaproteobacteria bacterium]
MRRAVQRHIAIFASSIPDLTPTQFAALAKLCELGQASQNELGRLTSMDVATVKGVVDRLRDRGLVSAKPLISDKRRLILTPTPKGKSLYNKLTAKAREVSQQTLSPLSKEESRQLIEILKKLV